MVLPEAIVALQHVTVAMELYDAQEKIKNLEVKHQRDLQFITEEQIRTADAAFSCRQVNCLF